MPGHDQEGRRLEGIATTDRVKGVLGVVGTGCDVYASSA